MKSEYIVEFRTYLTHYLKMTVKSVSEYNAIRQIQRAFLGVEIESVNKVY